MARSREKLFISTHNPIINGGVFQMMKFAGREMHEEGFDPRFIFPSHSIKDLLTFKIEKDIVDKFKARRYFTFPYIEFVKFLIPSLYQKQRNYPGVYQGLGGSALTGLPFLFNTKKYIIWIATTFKSEFRTQMQIFSHFQIYYLMNLFLYPFNRFFEGLVIKNAARVIALSEFTKKNIMREFGISSKKIEVINIPVDSNYFNFKARKFPQDREIRILSVGRLDDPRKNIVLLINGIEDLLKKGYRVKLILAGACKRHKLFNLKHELQRLKGHYELYISTGLDKIKELYHTSDIFVLASNQEGLGIVLLEAMSCGVPVISTNCGGPAEILNQEKNGFLIDCNSREQLVEALISLLENKDKYELFSEAGRNTVEEKFSGPAIRKKMLCVYKQVFPEIFKDK